MKFVDAVAALDARIIERMVPDLSRVKALADLLGHPEQTYPSLHITGTNGKTTTALVATELFRAFGLTTGTYTSPHLHSVTERIRFEGRPIGRHDFARTYEYLQPFLDVVDAKGERVTWFETLTVLAQVFFAEQAVEVAVVEVGMGGLWDATNLVRGEVAAITEVAIDHPELGSTPVEIAKEKAGIIKPGSIVVCGPQQEDVLEVIRAPGTEVRTWGNDHVLEDVRIALGGQSLTVRIREQRFEELFLPLHGEALARDATVALASVRAFLGDRDLDDELAAQAFAEVRSPGRLEVMRRKPLVILDGAHNPAAADALAEGMNAFRYDRLIVVASILADKDISGTVAPIASIADHFIGTQNSSPRAAPAGQIASVATSAGCDSVEMAATVAEAVALALAGATEDDCVLVTGSLYTVAEAREMLVHPSSEGNT